MRKIYIILTHTGTALSTIIKSYTKDEYSHVSIALDSDLNEMYSFGRLNPYNPFIGGFVHEYINRGTYKRFKNTKSEVYSLYVTDEQYKKAKKVITYFNENKEKYKFNILGLFCVSIHKKIKRKNIFYCAEFVKHVLKSSGIPTDNLPEIIKPEDLKKMQGLSIEYEGLFRKYKKKKHLKLDEMHDIILQPKEIRYV